MAIKIPIRTVYDASDNAIGLSEMQSGEAVSTAHGGTGLTALGSAHQVLKVNSAGNALEFVEDSQLSPDNYLQVANASILYVTKSDAVTGNTALLNLINDRMQVANVNTLVNTSVNNLVASAPGALDTLNELAAAISDDANFATTITDSIATKSSTSYVNTTFETKAVALASNTVIKSLVDDRIQVANASILYVTKSDAVTGNTGVLNYVNAQIGSSNTSIRNYTDTTYETKAVAVASNTALVNLINDRMQVANVNTLVNTSVNNLVAAAPGALDTLNELAAAIGDDVNFSTTITDSIATKAAITYVDASIGSSNTSIRAFVDTTFETKAVALASNTALVNLINDRMQVANASILYVTKTAAVTGNTGVLNYVNAQIGSSNTSIRNYTDTTYETKAVALASNTALLNLINDRMQVANGAVVGTRIIAGAGMTGGGTLAADRTLNVIAGTGITVNANDIATNDGAIVHDNLLGFVANEHIDHSGVSITAGAGLTGGGTIAATRDIAVGAGTYITVNANDVAVDATSAATASKVVARDSSGDFAGNVITAANFVSSSDINLKENINTIESAIDKVSALRGVNFNWKSTGDYAMGLVAQEVEKSIPEVVKDSNGVKVVNYDAIVGLLVEAIKEQQQEIYELKQIINNV